MDALPSLPVLLIIMAPLMFFLGRPKAVPVMSRRKCLQCNFEGVMDTWLGNHFFPKLVLFVGLLCYFVPGLIFWAWAWGKYKCPQCGAVGKNVSIPFDIPDTVLPDKKCPFCAEIIKSEAVVCRYCGKDLPGEA